MIRDDGFPPEDKISSGGGDAGRDGDADEEPILKYQRMGADLGKLLRGGDSVVRIAVHDSYMAFGTKKGEVHLTDYHGNKSRVLKPHSQPVTDISIDMAGDFLASSSEDGTVVISGLQPQQGGAPPPPEVYNFKSPILAVHLDPQYGRKKDKIFAAGGTRGRLLLNKRGWLVHEETLLHEGEGPISAIAWRGPLVAWASERGVKIMDVEKGKGGERISYVDRPRSTVDFKAHGCRCHLLWETQTRLLVAWGDTVMILQVLVREHPACRRHTIIHSAATSATGQRAEGRASPPIPLPLIQLQPELATPQRYTQIVAVWQSDCLVCGVSPFNQDSLILLGYVVEEEEEEEEEGEAEGLEEKGRGRAGVGSDLGVSALREREKGGEEAGGGRVALGMFQPEVHLVKRATGEVFSADTIPLHGWERTRAGDLLLRSTCWSMSAYRQDTKANATDVAESTGAGVKETRIRGLPPATFILGPQDLIVARVRDVDDKIEWALERQKFHQAVNTAMANMHLLRRHSFQDLVSKYLEDLMSRGEYDKAAAACPTLLEGDVTAWERWIYGFAQRRQLASVAPYVPVSKPRLPPAVYEVVLEHLLMTSPPLFLETLRRWGHPRGKHGGLQSVKGRQRIVSSAPSHGKEGTKDKLKDQLKHSEREAEENQALYSLSIIMARIEASLVRKNDPVVMESQAEAYMMDRQFPQAIQAYLALAQRGETDRGRRGNQSTQGTGQQDHSIDGTAGGIRGEQKDDSSRSPVGVQRMEDKGSVASRGKYDHVFQMIEQYSLFSNIQDQLLQLIGLDRVRAGELLMRHVDKLPVQAVVPQLRERRDLQHWYLGLLFERCPDMYKTQEYASFHILQVSLHAEFAPAFERGRPPPYNSAFIQFLKGSGFAPLEVALSECEKRSPPLFDEMAYVLGRMGDTRRALSILLEEVGSVPRAIEFVESHDKELWYQLVDYSLRNEAFLSDLLDHAGVYNVDLARLIAEVPHGMRVTGLRDKLVKIISDYHFQVSMHKLCGATVKSDLVRCIRRLNQNQRKAILVESGSCCCYGMCRMPLDGPPGGVGMGLGKHGHSRGRRAEGRGEGRSGGVYVFPCGHHFHAFCLGLCLEGTPGVRDQVGGRRAAPGKPSGGNSVNIACGLCTHGTRLGRR